MGGVILSDKQPENKTQACFILILYVEFIHVADLKHLMCIGMPLVNQKTI